VVGVFEFGDSALFREGFRVDVGDAAGGDCCEV
jgi:hypothetical protein